MVNPRKLSNFLTLVARSRRLHRLLSTSSQYKAPRTRPSECAASASTARLSKITPFLPSSQPQFNFQRVCKTVIHVSIELYQVSMGIKGILLTLYFGAVRINTTINMHKEPEAPTLLCSTKPIPAAFSSARWAIMLNKAQFRSPSIQIRTKCPSPERCRTGRPNFQTSYMLNNRCMNSIWVMDGVTCASARL